MKIQARPNTKLMFYLFHRFKERILWLSKFQILHHPSNYRHPAFTGDATVINGEVTETRMERRHGVVVVKVTLTNQTDAVMATATVEVRLPTE